MSSQSDITWWHFSDLHWEVAELDERRRFFKLLFSNLKDQIKQLGKPDFVVISGDISNTGDHLQLEGAKLHFIDQLRELCADTSLPILVVPGNHDLLRKQAKMVNPGPITSINSIAELDDFLDDQVAQTSISSPFANFVRFQNTLANETPDSLDALAWTRQFHIRGQLVNVVGVNTAWACGYHQDDNSPTGDERRLLLGLRQFAILPQRNPNAVLSILIMHHPLSWLKGFSEHQTKNHIQKNFDFVLFGHTHTLHDLSTQITPSGQSIYLPSPAIYTRSSSDSIEYARGYNIVVYNTKTRKGKAFYFKYNATYDPRFSPFNELYAPGQHHYDIDLHTPSTQMSQHDLFHSYLDVVTDYPNLMKIHEALELFIGRKSYHKSSLDIYDQISLEFLQATGLIELGTEAALWEAFVICRAYLTCELLQFAQDVRSFSPQKLRMLFEQFLRTVTQATNIKLAIDKSSYSHLATFTLETTLLSDTMFRSVPEHYLRYYATFWIFSQLAFFFNYPRVLPLLLSGDPRINDLRLDNESTPDINVVSSNYDKSNSQLTIQLRTRTRDGFLAVTTIQHYIDQWIKEVAELWRRQHLIFPPLIIKLEYPLWSQKDISGSYFAVEATSIIKLLMGKTFYGGTSHIWFRELLQNALDANSMRQALEGSTYESKIQIHFDGQTTCVIRDNGIGMSYQHIIRYLTTLGRSIWVSDELDEKASTSRNQHTIGRFGIGFVSVFQDADRVYVGTRFFRGIGEEGWVIDFQSIDKPFFVEHQPCDVGTVVRVVLNKPLAMDSFRSLVNAFFLYISDNIEIRPQTNIATNLEAVELVSVKQLSRSLYVDKVAKHSIGDNVFQLRTLFCYHYDKQSEKDKLPGSILQISNAGVKVFDQNTLFLKPGKRYIWVTEEEEESWKSYCSRDPINHYWVVLDFQKGFSPILPSRVEIDIEQPFSEELQRIIFDRFCEGLREVVLQEAAKDVSPRVRRRRILSCLTESIQAGSRYWRDKRYHPPSKYSDIDIIQRQVVDLYSEYCPLQLQDIEGNEQLLIKAQLNKAEGGLYVLESVAKTGLFKVFVRALGITDWITVEDEREFILAKLSLDGNVWQGIYNERDIYADGRRLFGEMAQAPLARYIRGDYALVDSDIFGKSAYIVLPSNLPNSWNRAEATKYTREQVNQECPARVLLNAHHILFEALDRYASQVDVGSAEESYFKMALDNFADGVVEQDRITVARERWEQLRQELAHIANVSLASITYDSLHG